MSAITYETVFIAEPEISNDQVDQLVSKIKQAITANQGNVTGEDRWGKRRMAYPITGFREGFYVVIGFTAESGAVLAIEHLYNVTDSVIRHLTTKIIKKNKVFPPRRVRPAGAPDSRHGQRPGGGYRGNRPDGRSSGPSAPSATPTPAAAAPASTETAAPAAAPAAPVATSTPEGGTPA